MVENPLVHIVSCSPRSGTTLFHEVMVNCFDVKLSYPVEKSIFRVGRIKQGLTVIKDPNEVFYMRPMLALEPRLHVIYLSRDPRDVVSSIHKGSAAGGYCTGLRKWMEYQQEFDRIKENPRVVEVKYEELVVNPDKVQADLQNTFPFLKKKLSFSSYHKQAAPSELSLVAMNGLRPISAVSLGGWKRNLGRVKQQLIECPDFPDVLVNYGYERGKEWMRVLDGISPLGAADGDFVSVHSHKMRYRIFRKCFWYFLNRIFDKRYQT